MKLRVPAHSKRSVTSDHNSSKSRENERSRGKSSWVRSRLVDRDPTIKQSVRNRPYSPCLLGTTPCVPFSSIMSARLGDTPVIPATERRQENQRKF